MAAIDRWCSYFLVVREKKTFLVGPPQKKSLLDKQWAELKNGVPNIYDFRKKGSLPSLHLCEYPGCPHMSLSHHLF